MDKELLRDARAALVETALFAARYDGREGTTATLTEDDDFLWAVYMSQSAREVVKRLTSAIGDHRWPLPAES